MHIGHSVQTSLFVVSVFLILVQTCVAADRPLAEDSSGVVCTQEADCLNESVCLDGVCYVPKTRYISFRPENAGQTVAFQITSPTCPGVVRWVDEPGIELQGSPGEFLFRAVETPVFREWTDSLVHVGDDQIQPGAVYEIRGTSDGVAFTDPLILPTVRVAGDLVGRLVSGEWEPPNGLMDWDDMSAAFGMHKANGIHVSRVDIWGGAGDAPNGLRTLGDITILFHLLGRRAPSATLNIFDDSECLCTDNAVCADDDYCNGPESCIDGYCLPGVDPCENQFCNEQAQACDPCLADEDCDDALSCNGVESCVDGECRAGREPCDGEHCVETTDSCGPTSNPRLDLLPISASGGNPVIVGNEISLEEGGHTVVIELRVSSWGSDILEAVNATIDPSGYQGTLAQPPNPGVDLSPVGFPDDPDRGAYTINNRCGNTGEPCGCPGDECVPSECGVGDSSLCSQIHSEIPITMDFAGTDHHGTTTLEYLFWIGSQFCSAGAEDVGTYMHVARLVLNVPVEAEGVYTVSLNPDPERTYLRKQCGEPWPTDLAISPVRIVLPADCNNNGVEDSTEIGTSGAPDCNGNQLIDECDLARGISTDCNENGTPDECDLAGGGSHDCDGSGVPDECEDDCDNNGLADECDILADPTLDADANGLLDRCEIPKNRYLFFAPDNSSGSVAYRVDLTFSEYFPGAVGTLGWVGEPGLRNLSKVLDTPYFSDAWPSSVSIGDCEIVPVATYALTPTPDGVSFGTPTVLATTGQPVDNKKWGDVVGAFDGTKWSSPQGVTNFDDVNAAIKKFQAAPGAAPMIWTDVVGETPNFVANFDDVLFLIKAFQGDDYPFSDPSLCP